MTLTSAERCHWRRQVVAHNEIQRTCRKSECLAPTGVSTGVREKFLSLAELLCILQRWGSAGDCNNFSSLFASSPMSGFLCPTWLCRCPSFMLQLPRLSLWREREAPRVFPLWISLKPTASTYWAFQKAITAPICPMDKCHWGRDLGFTLNT